MAVIQEKFAHRHASKLKRKEPPSGTGPDQSSHAV